MPLLVLPGLTHMAAFRQSISCPRASHPPVALNWLPYWWPQGSISIEQRTNLQGHLRLRIQNMQYHSHHILFLKVRYEIHLYLRRWGKSFHFWLRGTEKSNCSGCGQKNWLLNLINRVLEVLNKVWVHRLPIKHYLLKNRQNATSAFY